MEEENEAQYGFLGDILEGVVDLDLLPSGPPGSTVNYVLDLVTNGLVILFVGVIVVAIVYAALAGFKFIRSQGDTEKVEEAQSSLRNVLVGVASVFIGVLGVLIINGVFSDQQSPETLRKALCFYLEPSTAQAACVANQD